MLKDYLQQITLDLDIDEDINSEQSNEFNLQLDENINVTLIIHDEHKNIFTFFSSLGKIPAGDHEEFYVELMSANLFGQGTGGAVLSINSQNQLVLAQTFSYEINYQDFRDFLEEFVNHVDFWKEELKKLS